MPSSESLGFLLAHLARLPRALAGPLHRRRRHRWLRGLARQGPPRGHWWSDEQRWFGRGFPPRQGNSLRPLVDGDEVFPALLDAIQQAEHYIYITGWALTPAFSIRRQRQSPTAWDAPALAAEELLVEALARKAQHLPVKVLVWGGALLLLEPNRPQVQHTCDELSAAAPLLDCRADDRAPLGHSHHQKAIIVDGQVGFVGGFDLTTLDGDRWDIAGHPLRFSRNWHDTHLEVRGAAVADIEENFRQRWAEVTGERDLPRRAPVADPAWQTPCQVVRTIPKGNYHFARRGEFGIAYAYRAAIARARRFIYMENQYLWSQEIVDDLVRAIERNAESPFRIVIILPARADLGKYDNDKQIHRLREVDAGRGIVHAYSLYTGGPSSGLRGFSFAPIYVHSKVAIIDDEWYSIGSANLNRRGLATDTELNVQAIDREGARALRLRLWSEHLQCPPGSLADRDPVEVIDQLWPERAAEVAAIIERKRGRLPALVHPYETGRVRGIWLLQEAQSLLEGL